MKAEVTNQSECDLVRSVDVRVNQLQTASLAPSTASTTTTSQINHQAAENSDTASKLTEVLLLLYIRLKL